MLSLKNLSLRRGTRLLFENAGFTIYPGQKAGLTGANGSGKSSLLALILGQVQPDSGEFSLPPKTVIAHVAQETPATDRPALEYIMDGDEELRATQALLAQAEQANDGTRQAALHALLGDIHAYTAPSRAARLMHGLGFSPGQEQAPVQSFSGGWRMRLNLARALMCRSDLLLLDEPTNHLDLDAVIWLQDWLRDYPGTLLLISHDRDFLDNITDHIIHIEQGGIRLYKGNYSAFEQRRAELLAGQQAMRARQQREVAHAQDFIDRFRAKASKARQAQSRLKALARMQAIAPAHVDSPFHFEFPRPAKLPTPLLRLHNVAAGYGGREVITGVELNLSPGDRIGLLGPNGAGKSTLIKVLAGGLATARGERIEAQDLRTGYFAQHQIEQLRLDDSPLAHLQHLEPDTPEKDLRNYLGSFGFTGDKALESIAPFSGGEKARLALALVVRQKPNLLLLDEPTNHLDLEMRHALSVALQDFEGAMVVVSHDRHLLRTVTDSLLLVMNQRVQPFDGDLEDYRKWLMGRLAEDRAPDTGPVAAHSAAARKDQRRLEADRRAQTQPLRREIQKLEASLDKLTRENTELETRLADPALYQEDAKARLKELLMAQARNRQVLQETEDAWLAASEKLAAAEQAP